MKLSEWVQIFISGFVALVVLWQAWIYNQQRKLMGRHADYARLAERAYLGISQVEFDGLLVGEKPKVTVSLLNGGRTPAWDLTVRARKCFGLELPEPPDIEVPEGSGFLPAGTQRLLNFDLPLVSRPLLQGVIDGTYKLYIRGEAHFTDAWGDRRIYRFDLVYSTESNGFVDYKKTGEYKNSN